MEYHLLITMSYLVPSLIAEITSLIMGDANTFWNNDSS